MTRPRLLVVDDDPTVVEIVQAAFEGEGIAVDAADSGEEALRRLHDARPDVMLLDVRLPDINGLEMCRLLRDRGIDLPVILISSFTTMELTIRAMQEGAYDYLDKPLRPRDLVPLVHDVLSGLENGARETTAPGDPAAGEHSDLIGKSAEMLEVYKAIGRVAPTNATVLITGESGTGKEMVARVIHQQSRRRDRPFQAVDCAAIPETLLETELFGHEKGAFTGAVQRKPGKLELAQEGTLFLDEVGELPHSLQAKLLRALEQREIERVGGTARIRLNIRVLAATNRDLGRDVERGAFRNDLFYRLSVVRVHVPPLRDRGADLRLLIDHFVRTLGREVGRPIERIGAETYEALERYPWPGNVRELRNVLERSLILGRGPVLRPADLPELRPPGASGSDIFEALSSRDLSLAEVEAAYIASVLRRTDGNQTRAAEILGIHRSTLRRKLSRGAGSSE